MKSNLARFMLLAAVLALFLTILPASAEECPPAPPVPWWEVNPPRPRTRTRVVVRQTETIISSWEAYGIATTATKQVNVRSQASISSSKVATVRAVGTEVEVTARVKNSSGEVWYAVTLANGTLGYIRSDLLNTEQVTVVDYDAVPRQEEAAVTPEPPVQQQVVYVTPPPAVQPQATPTPILVYITPTPAPAAQPEVTPEVIYVFQEKENG